MPQPRIRRYLRHGTLPQLAVFEASARLGSFTRAAEELHLAQPTVSAQIRKLSETLGITLFEQVGRQVRLTDAGRQVHEHCLDVLAAFGRLDDSLQAYRHGASGELRLAIAGAATCFVTRMVTGFKALHPDIAIAVSIDNRHNLLARLDRRSDDLYLFADAPERGDIVRQAILANPLVVMAPRTHHWTRERRIRLVDLARQPLLLREAGSGTRARVLSHFERAGLTPNVRMELASDDAIRSAVTQGAGFGVLPRPLFSPEGSGSALAELDVEGFPLERHWHFAYPSEGRLSPAAEMFLRFVREETAIAPEPAAWVPAPDYLAPTTAWAIAASTASSSPMAGRSVSLTVG